MSTDSRMPTLSPGVRVTIISPDWANHVLGEIELVTASAMAPRRIGLRGFVGQACRGFWRWLRRS